MAAKPKVVTEWYKVNAWFKKKPLKVYNKDYFDGAKINFHTLADPASAEEIQKLEAFLGFPIPDELLKMLLLHNGEDNGDISLFFDMSFMSIDRIIQQVQFSRELKNESQKEVLSKPSEFIQTKYYSEKWIPVFTDNAGNYLSIDMDPGIRGTKNQIIIHGRDYDFNYWAGENLVDFFEMLVYQTSKSLSHITSLSKKFDLHFLDRIIALRNSFYQK